MSIIPIFSTLWTASSFFMPIYPVGKTPAALLRASTASSVRMRSTAPEVHPFRRLISAHAVLPPVLIRTHFALRRKRSVVLFGFLLAGEHVLSHSTVTSSPRFKNPSVLSSLVPPLQPGHVKPLATLSVKGAGPFPYIESRTLRKGTCQAAERKDGCLALRLPVRMPMTRRCA